MSVAEILHRLDAFAAVAPEELEQFASEARTLNLRDGEIAVHQHAVVDHLYVVLSGTLAVSCVDRLGVERALPPIAAGHVAGELQAGFRWTAPATLRARGDVVVAAIPTSALDRLALANPVAALRVDETLRPTLRRDRLRAVVHQSKAFAQLEPAVLSAVAEELEPQALYGGEVLFRQGEPGDSVCLVVSGRLSVLLTEEDGSVRVLAELGAGEVVGEMAYIGGEPRSATVVAARDTQLARLGRAGLDRLIERYPAAMLKLLAGRLVSRVRVMSRERRRDAPVVTVALVSATPQVPLPAISARVATALAALGPTRHLTSGTVEQALGRTGAAQVHDRDGGSGRLLEWLAAQEEEHRYVLYEADPSLTPWTERCVRQADRILLLADATADPAAGEIERQLLERDRAARPRHTLVLLHGPAVTSPTGTARWLDGRTIDRHLHVRLENPADVARLARFATGNTVGLVLGGGFARGLAHLGVLRALQERGIAVDAVGGASMGAMIGAQWVSGWDADRIVRDTSTGLADSFDDMTLPFLAFKRGGKYSRLVRSFFGDARIEDLWLPYFCVSANLNRAELAVHTRGSLADAVLASTRAPGIFPPVVMNGELHVDGGLINNVPVDVMRDFAGEGAVIGVDVSPPHELNAVSNYGDDLSGWAAFWSRFHPTRERRVYRPSILLVLMRVIEFGGISYRRAKADLADVYISPDVLRFKRNEFHSARAIADVGYAASHKVLGQWLEEEAAALRAVRPDLFTAP
jgi:predicted acylesterase/phospholipase RssA/CRP-like cAMP-binding protein